MKFRIAFVLFAILSASFGAYGVIMASYNPLATDAFSMCFLPLVLLFVTGAFNSRSMRNGRREWNFVSSALMITGSALAMGIIGLFVYSAIYNAGCESRLGTRQNLSGCRFIGLDLRQINLEGADLRGVWFRNVNLQEANLSNTNLLESDFQNAKLQGANLAHSNLSYADFSNADLTQAALDGAQLDHTDFQNATGLNDDTLAETLDVPPDRLAEALTRAGIRLESRQKIIDGVAQSCLENGQPVSITHNYIVGKGYHPLVLLNKDGAKHEWSDKLLDSNLEPMALRFMELVACIEPQQAVKIQSCTYIGSFLNRYQYSVTVRIIAVKTTSLVSEEVLLGDEPPKCPTVKGSETSSYGSEVEFDQIKQLLVGYVNPPK